MTLKSSVCKGFFPRGRDHILVEEGVVAKGRGWEDRKAREDKGKGGKEGRRDRDQGSVK